MDRYQEPADRNEAYAETSQERLGVRDEDWLTASTDENNRRGTGRSQDAGDEVEPPEDPETGLPTDDR